VCHLTIIFFYIAWASGAHAHQCTHTPLVGS
jgi:hypothetical protein